jgi:hypothetical protein
VTTLQDNAYQFGKEAALSLFEKEAVSFAALKAGLPKPGAMAAVHPGTGVPVGRFGVDPAALAAKKAKAAVGLPKPAFGKAGSFRKNAFVDLAIAGGLGAHKASLSKKHPNEELEGAARGVGGYWVGGMAGGILGAAAGALLGATAGNVIGGKPGAAVGLSGGLIAGALGGTGYGGYKGYKALTKKYDE